MTKEERKLSTYSYLVEL